MNKIFIKILILFFFITNQSIAEENIMILKLKDWDVKIELFEDVAPNHVKRIKELYEIIDHPDIEGLMCEKYDYMKLAYHPRVKKGIKIFLERKAKGQLESWELQAQ